MNFKLPYIPERPGKPRQDGLTMVMDKGLGIRQAEMFLEASSHLVDIVKLGFGTSFITPNLKEKIKLYQSAGMKVYLGGTFFEAFVVRDKYSEFKKALKNLGVDAAEVSDGSIILAHDQKCEYISDLARDFTVVSEVGSKEAGILISPGKWVKMMNTELEAGSWKVIAEARESGNVGIYRPNGSAHNILVNKIISKVPSESILWEAPQKPQQVWFIKLLGANVNLGNISPDDVIPLETLRLGLRGDTFFQNLPAELKKMQIKPPQKNERSNSPGTKKNA